MGEIEDAYAMASRLMFKNYGEATYEKIVRCLGDVLVEVEEGYYEGTTFVLLRQDAKYGVLIYGSGSCSGCDALQAASSHKDIGELLYGFQKDIKWYDTLAALKVDLAAPTPPDEIGKWNTYSSSWPEFQAKVAQYEE